MTERPYRSYPADIRVETAYGPISLAFTNGDHVSARTEGAINTRGADALTYRGAQYLVHVHLYASLDWHERADGYTSVKRRDNWSDAPRTYAPAMISAIRDAVVEYVTAHPGVLVQAEWCDASNALGQAETELDRAREALRAASKRRRAEAKRMDAAYCARCLAGQTEPHEHVKALGNPTV